MSYTESITAMRGTGHCITTSRWLQQGRKGGSRPSMICMTTTQKRMKLTSSSAKLTVCTTCTRQSRLRTCVRLLAAGATRQPNLVQSAVMLKGWRQHTRRANTTGSILPRRRSWMKFFWRDSKSRQRWLNLDCPVQRRIASGLGNTGISERGDGWKDSKMRLTGQLCGTSKQSWNT